MLKKGDEPAAVFAGLSKTLENRGHQKLHASILRGVLRELSASTKSTVPKLILAKKDDAEKLKAEISSALAALDAGENYSLSIDQTITGGFVLSYNHRAIDNSYKTKLLNWYRSAISK